MGCGASSAGKAVAEPQPLAVGAVGPTGAAAAKQSQPAVPSSTSPNSTSKMSGASTPVLAASWRQDRDGSAADEAECGENQDDMLQTGFRDEPSLQDRVNLLNTYVQTQNFGKTRSALQANMPDCIEDGESDDMDALYDLPKQDSELDASWRSKIFSYDGTDNPSALLHEVMTDTRWAKEVQIKACKIDSEAVKFLDKIVQDRELRAITLARCNLEDGVVAEIAQRLANGAWSSLRTVGLDGNQMLGDCAAEALAQALLTNTTLTELSLWGTGVGDAGAKSFASALRRNATLKNLWLGECEGISDEGAVSLQEALHENSSLDQLALVMTSVSDDVQDGIEELVATRREERAVAESRVVSQASQA